MTTNQIAFISVRCTIRCTCMYGKEVFFKLEDKNVGGKQSTVVTINDIFN